MKITSAKFIKGIVQSDPLLDDGLPKIAFIGRSNVGKSSLINSLTRKKHLAKTSSNPGRTQQINLFLINESFYLVDLPGYGYAKASFEIRNKIQQLIFWYLLDSRFQQDKVVLIIDAKVGPTEDDLKMLYSLEEQHKNIVIVANKIDKLNQSERHKCLQKIHEVFHNHRVIPYSSEKGIGINELAAEILK